MKKTAEIQARFGIDKYKVLGIVNILFSVFFWFILTNSSVGYDKTSFTSIKSFIDYYLGDIVFGFFFLINIFLAGKFFFSKKNKLSFGLSSILTLSTVFWFLFLFVGYFFASRVVFHLISVILVVFVYYLFLRFSKLLAIMISLVTLLIFLVTVITSFEEEYCWSKMKEPVLGNLVYSSVINESAKTLKWSSLKEGEDHFVCHANFNFKEALKERYSW